MANKIVIAAALCGFLWSFSAHCEEVMLDNGTNVAGVPVICSKTMAMRCEIGSKDAGNVDTLSACLDKIAAEALGAQTSANNIRDLSNKILRECSSNYYDLAVRRKSEAGDFEDVAEADGGMEKPTDMHGKATQKGKTISRNNQTVVSLVDLYSSLVILNTMEGYFDNLNWRHEEQEKKNRRAALSKGSE